MKLGVIDKDEYRQYRYWQTFQKLILPCATGFTVAGFLLEGADLRKLSQVVGIFLWALFVVTVVIAWLLGRHMVRDLPPSLQSLLLFSTDAAEDAPREGGDRLVSVEPAGEARDG